MVVQHMLGDLPAEGGALVHRVPVVKTGPDTGVAHVVPDRLQARVGPLGPGRVRARLGPSFHPFVAQRYLPATK